MMARVSSLKPGNKNSSGIERSKNKALLTDGQVEEGPVDGSYYVRKPSQNPTDTRTELKNNSYKVVLYISLYRTVRTTKDHLLGL